MKRAEQHGAVVRDRPFQHARRRRGSRGRREDGVRPRREANRIFARRFAEHDEPVRVKQPDDAVLADVDGPEEAAGNRRHERRDDGARKRAALVDQAAGDGNQVRAGRGDAEERGVDRELVARRGAQTAEHIIVAPRLPDDGALGRMPDDAVAIGDRDRTDACQARFR